MGVEWSTEGIAMLTLTRKVGERIIVGDEIVIEVKEIRRNHVRIGVQAPDDVKIHREEVWERIHAGELEELTLPLRAFLPGRRGSDELEAAKSEFASAARQRLIDQGVIKPMTPRGGPVDPESHAIIDTGA